MLEELMKTIVKYGWEIVYNEETPLVDKTSTSPILNGQMVYLKFGIRDRQKFYFGTIPADPKIIHEDIYFKLYVTDTYHFFPVDIFEDSRRATDFVILPNQDNVLQSKIVQMRTVLAYSKAIANKNYNLVFKRMGLTGISCGKIKKYCTLEDFLIKLTTLVMLDATIFSTDFSNALEEIFEPKG